MPTPMSKFRRREPKIRTEMVLISPAIATKWLEIDTINRKISQDRVDRYAAEMRAGEWDEDNGETLKIAEDGGVLDGQHRLWAIIESGVTLRFLVVFDVDKESFKTIDTGMARTTGQIVGMSGVKSGNNVAAAAALIMALQTGKYGLSSGQQPSKLFQRSKVIEFALSNKSALEASVRATYGTGKLTSISTSAAVHYLIANTSKAMKAPEQATAFFDQLAKGLYDGRFETSRHPIYVLREKLAANRTALSKLSMPAQVALIIKTWNAYITGKAVTALRMTAQEGFPCVV